MAGRAGLRPAPICRTREVMLSGGGSLSKATWDGGHRNSPCRRAFGARSDSLHKRVSHVRHRQRLGSYGRGTTPPSLYAVTMRLVYPLVFASAASAQLFPSFLTLKKQAGGPEPQQPLMPVVPSPGDDKPAPDFSSGILIADTLARDRGINIFGGFTRDIESVYKRLEDGSKNATVLCPENAEITRLPRKPWEDPEDYKAYGEQAYHGDEGEDRAHKNLRRFVEAHIVPESPWKAGDKVKTLAGNVVWYEIRDGRKIVSSIFWPLMLAKLIATDSTWKH